MCVGCARAWVGGIVRTAPWVVVAHSNLFSLGGAASGECFAAGERVPGSPTTCLLLPLYIRFYRLAAPCRVVSLPRGFSYVLSLSVVGILVVLFFSTLCLCYPNVFCILYSEFCMANAFCGTTPCVHTRLMCPNKARHDRALRTLPSTFLVLVSD